MPRTPDVLTLFFCGTSSSAGDETNYTTYWNGELINKLRSNIAGQAGVDYVQYDGPGTSGNWLDRAKGVAVGGGKGGVDDNTAAAKGRMQKRTGKFDENVKSALWEHQGKMANVLQDIRGGQGGGSEATDASSDSSSIEGYLSALLRFNVVYDSYKKAKGTIGERFVEIPKTINLLGWSRGGVTCLTVANALDRVLTTVGAATQINIFAIDPVPGYGSGDMETDKTRVPDRCGRYVGVYAMHERSRFFSAVMPHCPPGVQKSIVGMPGRHATIVGNAHSDGAEGGRASDFHEPGVVTRDLAEKTLHGWGTQFKSNTTFNLNDRQLLNYYEQMLKDIQAGRYDKMSQTNYLLTSQGQKRSYILGGESGKAEYVSDGLGRKQEMIFVNLYHKQLFDRLHPNGG